MDYHGLLVITGWQVAFLVGLAPFLARGHEARIPESLSAPTGLEGSETPWVAYSLLLPTEQLAAGQGWLRNLSVTAKLVSLLWGCESGEDLAGPGRLQLWEVWGTPWKGPWEQVSHFLQSFCVSLDSVTKQGAGEQWFYHCPVLIFYLGLALPLSTAHLKWTSRILAAYAGSERGFWTTEWHHGKQLATWETQGKGCVTCLSALEVSNTSSLQEFFKDERTKPNLFHLKEILQYFRPINAMFKDDMGVLEPDGVGAGRGEQSLLA